LSAIASRGLSWSYQSPCLWLCKWLYVAVPPTPPCLQLTWCENQTPSDQGSKRPDLSQNTCHKHESKLGHNWSVLLPERLCPRQLMTWACALHVFCPACSPQPQTRSRRCKKRVLRCTTPHMRLPQTAWLGFTLTWSKSNGSLSSTSLDLSLLYGFVMRSKSDNRKTRLSKTLRYLDPAATMAEHVHRFLGALRSQNTHVKPAYQCLWEREDGWAWSMCWCTQACECRWQAAMLSEQPTA
jgi:hypothetical protein